jgi:hypothetical protein
VLRVKIKRGTLLTQIVTERNAGLLGVCLNHSRSGVTFIARQPTPAIKPNNAGGPITNSARASIMHIVHHTCFQPIVMVIGLINIRLFDQKGFARRVEGRGTPRRLNRGMPNSDGRAN